ncbi:MAG: ATP-binding protein [Micropepsaceae bacterium]
MSAKAPSDLLRFGRFELRLGQRQLLVDGQPAVLGARAFDILLLLAERHGFVVTKAELFAAVWPGVVVEENNLQVQISALRKVLGADAIATVPGRGYQFTLAFEAPKTEARAVPAATSRRPRGRATRFIGRDRELAALNSALTQALGGRGDLVLLAGEPGVGKTRLAEEIAEAATQKGALVLTGRCYEAAAAIPYTPITEMLGQATRVLEADRLRALLGGDAGPVATICPELRKRFDVVADQALQQDRSDLANGVRDFFERCARAQPLVLLFDDMHWADEATLDLFRHIVDRAGESPMLVIGTYRNVDVDMGPAFANCLVEVGRRGWGDRLVLRKLSEADSATLIGSMVGQDFPTGLAASIYQATDGNPFFLEEVVKHLAEEGHLVDASGHFRSNAAIGDIEVPENVRLVIGKRLARLSKGAREALDAAAAAGRRFGLALLEALDLGGQEAILAHLDEAEAARLIVADGADYRFAHELIRHTLHAGLTQARRHRLHLRVAEALERIHAAEIEEHAAEIAHHLTQAGSLADTEKSVRFLQMAGGHASKRSAFEEATQNFRQAIERLKTLPETPQRDERELQIGVGFAIVLHATKGSASPESVALVARNNILVETVGDLKERLERRFAKFVGAFMAGNWTEASPLAGQLLDMAVSGDGDEATVGYRRRLAHYALFISHYYCGDVAGAEKHFESWSSLSRFKVGQERYRIVPAVSHGGFCARHLGRSDLARQRNAEANVLARESEDPWEISFAQMQEGILHAFLDDPCSAEAASSFALATAKERGLRQIEGLALPVLGWAQARQGRPREGLVLIGDGIAKLSEIGNRVTIPLFLTFRAEAEALDGGIANALASYEEALTFTPKELVYRPQTLIVRGELRSKLGDSELAEKDFREAIALAREMGARGYELRATTGLARLIHGRGDTSAARSMLAPVLAWFTEGFDTRDVKEAAALLKKLA